MKEIVHNICSKYDINGILIELVSESNEDVKNTYYIIDDCIYCLGNEEVDICTAIMGYEHFFNVRLTDSELEKFYSQYL